MPNEICRPNNVSEQDASDANVNMNVSDKETSVNLCNKKPLKPKPQIKLPHAQNNLGSLIIYHQNIRGLRGKPNELRSQIYPTFPHVLCISEHHMYHLELQQILFDNYKLGASYCRKSFENGGVCIFVQDSIGYINLDLQIHCNDKDF